jgi:hypothetical protein
VKGWNVRTGPLVLGRVARPGAHLGKAKLLEKLADIARVIVDAEALGDDPLEIDPAVPHNAVDFPVRTRNGVGPLVQISGGRPDPSR